MNSLLMFFSSIPMLLCIGAASYLAYMDKEGWGWFLFIAVLIAPIVKTTTSKTCQPNNHIADRAKD